MSRPDLRDPFMSLFWFGQGVSWGGHSMFCVSMIFYFYVLAGYGSQSGTAVYRDWEPYIGNLFPTCVCGKLTLFMAQLIKHLSINIQFICLTSHISCMDSLCVQ